MPFFSRKKRSPKTLTAAETLAVLASGQLRCGGCGRTSPLADYEALLPAGCVHCGEMQFVPGRVDRFWLTHPLGVGGMGAVYKGMDRENPARPAAVKVLPRDRKDDADLIKNLEHETEIIAALGHHPCMVGMVGGGCADGEYFLATQMIDGERLDVLIERSGRMPEAAALLMGLRLLAAEAHIYNQGYLFRDMKPENIIIHPEDGAYLFDYGICMPLAQAKHDVADDVQGSVLYFPPERVTGEGEQASSEIYSVGMVLYHALAGVPFFRDDELMGVVEQHMRETRVMPVESKLSRLSPDIAAVIERMTRRVAEERYQTFLEVEGELLRLYHVRMWEGRE